MSPFDYVKALTETKEYLFDEGNIKDYNAFIINKALSFNVDCLFFVNEMNKYSSFVPIKNQHDFYYYGLDKKKRYGRWVKKDSLNKDIDLIKLHYGYNTEDAIAALNIISDEQLQFIREMIGGKQK